jgi:hypothetical protein
MFALVELFAKSRLPYHFHWSINFLAIQSLHFVMPHLEMTVTKFAKRQRMTGLKMVTQKGLFIHGKKLISNQKFDLE